MTAGPGETLVSRGPLHLVELRAFTPLGADVVVTTRRGGVSKGPYDALNLGDHVGDDPEAVEENRRRLALAMGVGRDALVIARQVHGASVAAVRMGDEPGDADGIATRDARVALAVLVADCVPLVLLDPDAAVLVVAHAGWRGTAARVAAAAVDAAVSLGAARDALRAAIGPSVAPSRYQVGDDVADALRDAGCAHALSPDGTGKFRADLAMANASQLRGAGLLEEHVWCATERTDAPRYFSDRAHRPCGRFALVARIVARRS